MKTIKKYLSKEFDDLLRMTPEEEKEIEDNIDAFLKECERREEILNELGIEERMRRFYFDIETLKKHGYKPIAVTVMVCENTFVFRNRKRGTTRV